MQPKVEEYVKKVEQQVHEAEEQDRERLLLNIGLTYRVYGPGEEVSDEFPYYDIEEQKCYKKAPLPVTEEEYQAVKRAYERVNTKEETSDNNGIASILYGFSTIIYIAAFILGLIFGRSFARLFYEDFSFAVAMSVWVVGFVIGTLMRGYAEIIKLLQEIKNK